MTQSLTLPESAQPSVAWLRQLTAQQGTSSAGWGYRELKGQSYCISPRLLLYGGEHSPQERWCLQYGRGIQHKRTGGCPLSSLPKITMLVSPHITLVHSPLPPPDSRISGCKQDVMHWPLEAVPVSLADSYFSLANRILTDFHSQILCGHFFPALVLWARRAWLGVVIPCFSEEIVATEISPQNLSQHLWEQTRLFLSLSFLPVSMWLLL